MKSSKKIVSIILCIAMIASMFVTMGASAVAENLIWDGTTITKPVEGNGTADTPYLISNGEELAWFVALLEEWKNPRYAKLTADIYLNDITKINWKTGEALEGYTPRTWLDSTKISADGFLGNLNGDGHIIYGMYFNDTDSTASVGLIPKQHKNYSITVKNLGIENAYISSNGYVGAIIADGGGNEQKTVENCFVGKNVTVSGTDTGTAIARGSKITIDKFYSMATVSGSGKYGLVGDVWTASAVSIKNTFIVGSPITTDGSSWTCEKVYSTDITGANPSTSTAVEIHYSSMKGTDVLTNADKMPMLSDCGAFTATKGYPYLSIFPYVEVIEEIKMWDGVTITKPYGAGTEEKPYLIENAEELAWFVTLPDNEWVNTRYAKLISDIYLNDITKINWQTGVEEDGYTPNVWLDETKIHSDGFLGNIDGDGHIIYGLYFKNTDSTASVGLIPKSHKTHPTIVKNLGIDNAYISNNGNASAILANGDSGCNKTIENCFVGSNVTIRGNKAGVAVATGYKFEINKFYSLATVSGTTSYGIVADSWSGNYNSLKNSYAVGTVVTSKYQNPIACSNVYVTDTTGADGAKMINDADMQGLDVLTNEYKMIDLADCDAFTATNGYPVLSIFPINEESLIPPAWDGSITKPEGSGSTEADPYLITNGAELAWYVSLFEDWKNPRYAKLTADIYLNDIDKINWQTGVAEDGYTPKSWIDNTDGFLGTLDGDNHIIYGMYYNAPSANANAGLIPNQHNDFGLTIKNLGIDKAYIASAGNSAAFIAKGESNGVKTIENCYAGENVTIKGNNAGVAMASGNNITINKFYSLAKVTGTTNYGVVADSWGTKTMSNAFVVDIPITSKNENTVTCTNVYANVNTGGTGSNKLATENMKGLSALTVYNKMPKLAECGAFKTTSGYPVLASFGFEEENVVITLNANGGELVTTTISAPAGAVVEFPAPAKDGYTFKAWYKDSSFKTIADNIVPEQATTYYAKWYKKFDINNDGVAAQANDLAKLRIALLNNNFNDAADFSFDAANTNNDDVINLLDLIRLKKKISGVLVDNIGEEYRLVWSDEFSGSQYDASKWGFDDGYKGDQVGNADNFSVANGVATLSTTYNAESGKYELSNNLVSGNTMNFKYGYIEFRAKMPYYGEGEWPALWLLSSTASISKNLAGITQPDYNLEIDIAEIMSDSTTSISQLHLWHNTDSNLKKNNIFDASGDDRIGSWTGNSKKVFESTDIANQWHTYGLKWTETTLIFYVDGVEKLTYNVPAEYAAEFSEYTSIVISNNFFTPEVAAENSEWATAGTYFEENPNGSIDLEIDYVRLYQNPQTDSILIK